MVDTSNAHVRKERGSNVPQTEANEAQRLLNDPAYTRGFNNVRDFLIRELETLKHDGSPEMDNYEREICRTLRTLTSTKRAMTVGIQGQDLRAAGFRPRKPETEEQKQG